MRRTLLKSKVHRVTVTEACLHYEGSFTLDEDLMDAARLVPYERIEVVVGAPAAQMQMLGLQFGDFHEAQCYGMPPVR